MGVTTKRLPYQYQIGKTPIIGPWYGRIGRVYNILSAPCQPEPLIIVQAAAVALPRMIYGIFGPDCLDDAYDYLKGKRKGHGRNITFQTLGTKNPLNPVTKGLTTLMIPIGDLVQRIGWYMSIVDATTEFLVNWTSLIYQYSGCPVGDQPYAYGHAIEGIHTGSSAHTSIFTGWARDSQYIFAMDAAAIVVGTGFSPGVGFSLTTGKYPFPGEQDATWTAELISLYNSNIFAKPEVKATREGGLTTSWYDFSAYDSYDAGPFAVRITKSEGAMWVTSGFFGAYGVNKKQLRLGINPSKCNPFTHSKL